MKTIVVYYSLSGNTKYAAEYIAEKLEAELLEIHPAKEYPKKGLAKFFHGGKDSSAKSTPALAPYEFNADGYDNIILGCPLWAWNLCPPMRTFLSENDLSGKRVSAFISGGGGNDAKAFAAMEELTKHSLTARLSLTEPLKNKDAAREKLNYFCEKLKQTK